MTRRTMMFRLLLCATAAAVTLPPATAKKIPNDGVFRLLILHTADMHSRFDDINRDGEFCDENPCYGGFARLKAAVDRERALARSDPAIDGDLFLNAGDTFQGTAFFTFFGWGIVARMLQSLGIDVMSLGNHEFDNGPNDTWSFVNNITTPVVACNLDLSGEPLLANEPNLMKSKVLTVKGRKIGIIGYLTPATMEIANVGNVKILPEIPRIQDEARRLKKNGVDILIALGHSGFDADKMIAKEVDDIDLVIGGHTNTFLYSGNPPDYEKPEASYPFEVEQPRTQRKVPIVHAYYLTKYLGKLWIEFDNNGEVIKSYGNPILLDSQIKQDQGLLNEVEHYKELIAVRTKEVLGSTSVVLEGINDFCRTRECNLGNFVTDSFINYNVRHKFKSFDLSKRWTDAPIAMIQSGGLRSNINSTMIEGKISVGELIAAFPFQNDIGTVVIKGSEIWKAFEYSVVRYNGVKYFGEFLQVSGLKVVIDFSQPPGKRVVSIKARCGECLIPVYEKLDLNANYTVLMSKYLLDGGDGHSFKTVVGFKSLEVNEFDIIKEEIHISSPLWPEVDGRITFINFEKLKNNITSGQHVSAPLMNITFILVAVMYIINKL